MVQKYNFFKKSFTSLKEEKKLAPLIAYMLELSEKARREGILFLEAEIKDISIPFLKSGLRLVVDGIRAEVINEILTTRIYFSRKKGKKFLEMLLIHQGIISIQARDNPRLLEEKFVSLTRHLNFHEEFTFEDDMPVTPQIKRLKKLAKDYQAKADEYNKKLNELVNKKKREDFDELINEITSRNEDNPPVSDILETLLKGLDRTEIGDLIDSFHRFEPDKRYGFLAEALRGSSKQTVLKVLKNTDPEYDWPLIRYYRNASKTTAAESLAAQQEIRNEYTKISSPGNNITRSEG